MLRLMPQDRKDRGHTVSITGCEGCMKQPAHILLAGWQPMRPRLAAREAGKCSPSFSRAVSRGDWRKHSGLSLQTATGLFPVSSSGDSHGPFSGLRGPAGASWGRFMTKDSIIFLSPASSWWTLDYWHSDRPPHPGSTAQAKGLSCSSVQWGRPASGPTGLLVCTPGAGDTCES